MIMSFHDMTILLWLHAASKTLNLEQVCYLFPLVCRSRYFMVSLSPFLHKRGSIAELGIYYYSKFPMVPPNR